MNQNPKQKLQPFVKQILITNDNLDQKVTEFIEQLEKYFLKFQARLNDEQVAWSKWLNQANNVFIEPEKLAIKSPLTILDAPWGTGKTYFIEQLVKKFIDPKFRDKTIFKNLVVIDSWKYINSDYIVLDFAKQIYQIYSKMITNNKIKTSDKKTKSVLKKLKSLIWLILPIAIGLGLITTKIYHPEAVGISNDFFSHFDHNHDHENESDFDYEQALEEVNQHLEHTIIVLDNVERMNQKTWEVIKIIQKFSIFDKFIFVMPMNKKQIFTHSLVNPIDYESMIDKYISLGIYFQLEQDYLGFLAKINFAKEHQNLVNHLLNQSINGHKLSIRVLENALIKFENLSNDFQKCKYRGLNGLRQIWPTPAIDQIIKNDIDNFLNALNQIHQILFKIQKWSTSRLWKMISNHFKKELVQKTISKKLEAQYFAVTNQLIDHDFSLKDCLDPQWLISLNQALDVLNQLQEQLVNAKNDYGLKTIDNVLISAKLEIEKMIVNLEQETNKIALSKEQQCLSDLVKNTFEQLNEIDEANLKEWLFNKLIESE